MDTDTCNRIICSLVLSRLNFCCVLYNGLPKKSIARLQRVQNYAVKIVSMQPKYAHVTPLLNQLKWLKIENFAVYRTATIVYNCLYSPNSVPEYLLDLIQMYIPSRSLRSQNLNLLTMPKLKSKFVERAFSYQAPLIWNNLPDYIKNSASINIFKAKLKQYLLSLQ